MHLRITKLEREIDELKCEDYGIKKDLDKIKMELVDKTPEYFSWKDVMRAFIGALFFAFSVAFSGNILNIAENITPEHLMLVIIFTVIILTAEIYFIGYSHVTNKNRRSFGQFCVKRLVAFYLVALVVSFVISYIFGLIFLVKNPQHYYNLVIIISSPASIGASISDLLKKY